MAFAASRVLPDWPHRAVRIGLLVGALGILLTTFATAELALADLASTSHANANTSLARRLKSVWDDGDHLHYAIHLAAGRLLALCPCSAQAAAGQYRRASYHARSDWQVMLLTTERPTSSTARVADGLDLVARWLQWSVSAAARLPTLVPR